MRGGLKTMLTSYSLQLRVRSVGIRLWGSGFWGFRNWVRGLLDLQKEVEPPLVDVEQGQSLC